MSVHITRAVLNQIKNTIGREPIESGGIIGGKDQGITHFCFDNANHNAEYIPNVKLMNEVISSWAKDEIILYGIVHSHPSYSPAPSKEDLEYAIKLKRNNPFLDLIIFPILIKNEKDEIVINFYQLIDDVFTKIDIEVA